MKDIGSDDTLRAGATGQSAVVFAGQGSQVAGMGASLFGLYPEIVAQADRILGYSVTEICRDNPGKA